MVIPDHLSVCNRQFEISVEEFCKDESVTRINLVYYQTNDSTL